MRLRFGGKRVLFKYIDLNYEMLVLISKHLPGLNIVAVTEAIPVQIIKAAESFILEPVNTVSSHHFPNQECDVLVSQIKIQLIEQLKG